MRRKSKFWTPHNALAVAKKRANNLGDEGVLTSDEQRILAQGYLRLQKELKRIRTQRLKEAARFSELRHEAYKHGVRDGLSRASISPGFGDMGG